MKILASNLIHPLTSSKGSSMGYRKLRRVCNIHKWVCGTAVCHVIIKFLTISTVCFFFFLGSICVLTKNFILARHALYCFNHASSPFCLVFWSQGLDFCPGLLDCDPFLGFPLAGMTGMCHDAQLSSIEGVLHTLLPGLASDWDPPNLSFSSS
jgi:hypothetical protein